MSVKKAKKNKINKIKYTHLYCPYCMRWHYESNLKITETIIDGTYISCKEFDKIITGYTIIEAFRE